MPNGRPGNDSEVMADAPHIPTPMVHARKNVEKEVHIQKLVRAKARSLLQCRLVTQRAETLELTADRYKSQAMGVSPRTNTERSERS